jgi:hypothetical protein
MSETEKPTIAFVLSLIGGIFILLGGGTMSMMGSDWIGGMMKGYWGYGMMRAYGSGFVPWYGMMGGYGSLGLVGIAGVLFGVVVIVSSLMLYRYPADHTKWGTIVLIFSMFSILSGMDGLVGLILGVLGGAFALAWKPTTRVST